MLIMTSRVQYIRHRLQHTCSVYFSVHYDRERDEKEKNVCRLCLGIGMARKLLGEPKLA